MVAAARKPLTRSPRAPRAVVPRAGGASDRTRAELIETALGLFARRGIGSVSLREIVQKAGQGNQSAVHYHFRDKQGLVLAVTNLVREMFQPYLEEAMANIETKERDGGLSDDDLIAALVLPLIRVFHSDETGRDAIRFVARLIADGGDMWQALILRESTAFLVQIEKRLVERLPGKDREKLWLQILLSISSALFGLTAIGSLRFAPFGNRGPLYSGRRDESIRDFIDFVGHGLLGER